MLSHRPLFHRFDSDYAYDYALAREKELLGKPGMYSRDEFDRIAGIFSYGSSLDLAHDLAIDEGVRRDRDEFDRQYFLDHSYEEGADELL